MGVHYGFVDTQTTAGPATEASAAIPIPKRSAHLVDLPESRSYRVKRKLLGPPLDNADLEHERLGIPTGLAVFASDNVSSVAYATEEILHVLIPVVGVLAFSLVMPITVAMCLVLFVLILSYRQTIKEYPTAGGAYMVTRDNFGLFPAQIAGVSLLTDYILTVSVSTAAGTAALASFFPALTPYSVPIAIGFVALIAFGNLKGVKDSGKVFAVPTYFFVVMMVIMLGVGFWKLANGGLHEQDISSLTGAIDIGREGNVDAFLYGATIFVVLHAFASGGAAVTGVEAISNGVTAFRKPEWRNARKALVIMGSTLGVLFLGLSFMAIKIHPVPYEDGVPTVISQIGKEVFGDSAAGHVLYALLQVGTVLILILAANTGFADFPRLASFQAGDNFMPRQLTKRGHRLVFSNGVIFLAGTASVLLLVTGAEVSRLIPLYAIGVFTSFTLSQAGMARHHLRKKEPGWKSGIAINGVGAVMTLIVAVIILLTKFTEGAWVIVIVIPLLVCGAVPTEPELRARGDRARAQRTDGAGPELAGRPQAPGHRAGRRVGRSGRAGTPVRAVVAARRSDGHAHRPRPDPHDRPRRGLGPARLHQVPARGRRLPRPSVRSHRGRVRGPGDAGRRHRRHRADPASVYQRYWHRLVHDNSANTLAKALSGLPNCTVTFVPYLMGSREGEAALVAPLAAASPTDGVGTAVPTRRLRHRRTARAATASHMSPTGSTCGSPARSAPSRSNRCAEPRRSSSRWSTIPVRSRWSSSGVGRSPGVGPGRDPDRRGSGRRTPGSPRDAQPGVRDRPRRPTTDTARRSALRDSGVVVRTRDHRDRRGRRRRRRQRRLPVAHLPGDGSVGVERDRPVPQRPRGVPPPRSRMVVGPAPRVPCVGWVVAIIFLNDLSRLFGRSIGFTIGLVLLPTVFLALLAFGRSTYVGPPERVV